MDIASEEDDLRAELELLRKKCAIYEQNARILAEEEKLSNSQSSPSNSSAELARLVEEGLIERKCLSSLNTELGTKLFLVQAHLALERKSLEDVRGELKSAALQNESMQRLILNRVREKEAMWMDNVREADGRVAVASAEIKRLSQELELKSEIEQEIGKVNKARVATLECQLTELRDSCAEQVATLQAQAAAAENSFAQASSREAALQSRVADLESGRALMQKDSETLAVVFNERLREQQAKQQQIEQQLTKTQAENCSLQDERDTALRKLAVASQTISELQTQKKSMTRSGESEKGDLRLRLKQITEKVAALEKEHETDIAAANTRLAAMAAQMESQLTTAKRMEATQAEMLAASQEDAEASRGLLQQEQEQRLRQREEQQHEGERLREAHQTTQRQNKRLQADLENEAAAARTARSEVSAKESQLVVLQQQLDKQEVGGAEARARSAQQKQLLQEAEAALAVSQADKAELASQVLGLTQALVRLPRIFQESSRQSFTFLCVFSLVFLACFPSCHPRATRCA
jgi:hypothetical protein